MPYNGIYGQEKDVAMVHPAVFYPDGRLQYTSRLLPRPIDVFARRFLPGCLVRGINRRYLLEQYPHTVLLTARTIREVS